MKKQIVLTIALAVALIFTSGCGKEEEKLMTCTLKSNDVTQDLSVTSTYKVYYQGDVVNKVESKEEVASSNEETLKTIADTTENTYETLNKAYGGYTFEVKRDSGKITSEATIDYGKMDLKQLLKDQPTMKNYMNSDSKLTKKGAQSMYEELGATCE